MIPRFLRSSLLILPSLLLLMPQPRAAAQDADFNAQSGFLETQLSSEFQSKPSLVELLLPDQLQRDKKYPVLYILPVGGKGGEFGDGLVEAKKADLANKAQVICVSPYFAKVPWIGDHASDPKLQQEKYVLQTLIPWVDKTYPTQRDAEGRWLIGFSKAGWAACTLLLRHPETFGYAAAWDVPFLLNGENSGADWGPMGIQTVFGTKEQMQKFLPTRLAEENVIYLRKRSRLAIAPGKFWKNPSEEYHLFLESRSIPHEYRADLIFPHRWDTGWFFPMSDVLIKMARTP